MTILYALLILAANGAVVFLAYRSLRRRIDAASASTDLINQVRAEIGQIITELNQVTDRNIGLVEGKIAELSRTLEEADKKIVLLSREGEKLSVGKRYSQLRPRVSILPDVVSPVEGAAAAPITPTLSSKPAHRNGGEGPSQILDQAQSRAQAQVEAPRGAGGREEVVAMYRQGIDRRLIAKKLHKTIGEIDLIISLEERKGHRSAGS